MPRAPGGVTVVVVVVVVVVVAAVVLSEDKPKEEVATSSPTPQEIEDMCMPWLHHCLENDRQPRRNWSIFGTKKPCGDCFQECKHKKGAWPDGKCPRHE